MSPAIVVRPARANDKDTILSLVDALAEFEKLDPPDEDAKRRLMHDAFGPEPRFEILLAECDGHAVGYAFYFETYSSFLALPTLYLEDLFVLSEFRKLKAGYALFRKCVEEADRRGCGRVDFAVLDWNEPARDFYKRLGAAHLDDWCLYRLTRGQFKKVLT